MWETHEIFSYTTPVEGYYPLEVYRNWTTSHTYLPLLTVAGYVLMIAAGREYMKDRKPLQLRGALFAWNAGLAIYSMISMWRATAFLWNDIRTAHSFRQVVCHVQQDNVAAFWNMAFVVSKFVELGDTVFLVARKRNVLFLHWYHHASVLLYTWVVNVDNAPLGKFFMIMNVFVHSLMYTYYALAAAGVHLPKPVSMTVTSLQISQMVGGMFFLCASAFFAIVHPDCDAPARVLWLGFLMYGSYFAIFVNFFINAYFGAERKRQLPKSD